MKERLSGIDGTGRNELRELASVIKQPGSGCLVKPGVAQYTIAIARLVYVSSGTHQGVRPRMDDLLWTKRAWSGFSA